MFRIPVDGSGLHSHSFYFMINGDISSGNISRSINVDFETVYVIGEKHKRPLSFQEEGMKNQGKKSSQGYSEATPTVWLMVTEGKRKRAAGEHAGDIQRRASCEIQSHKGPEGRLLCGSA